MRKGNERLASRLADELAPVSPNRWANHDGDDAGEDDESERPDDLAHRIPILPSDVHTEGSKGNVRQHYVT